MKDAKRLSDFNAIFPVRFKGEKFTPITKRDDRDGLKGAKS